ncbi:rhodanese-like domain-containing protein [Agaribacter flavus]|uniref:Rhodanese-like domain-containing protein n=1 Tax=Agaribacter flavus TaxID=1902781 RepID=A0ABV7FSV8_9ALTE
MDHFIEFARDNMVLSIIWVALVVMLIYSYIAPMLSSVKRVNNHQATLLINKEDAIVLDIRPQKDFKTGHIHGATQIKPDDVRNANFSKLEKEKNTPIIVVCAMGNLASGTANSMSKQGFANVSILEGGMSSWQSASLPVSK